MIKYKELFRSSTDKAMEDIVNEFIVKENVSLIISTTYFFIGRDNLMEKVGIFYE